MMWPFPDKRERFRRQAARWLARLLGEPSEADLKAFRRWHDADAAHADAFARASSGYEVSAILRRSELFGPDEAGRLLTRPSRQAGYALAASVAAVLAVSAIVVLGSPPRLSAPEARILVFTTEVGEIRSIELSDGTQMTLDTASSVRVEFLRDLRQVSLARGRARFKVAGDDARPFVVDAGPHRIVGGATFDVTMDEAGATVRAIEGSVSVEQRKAVPGKAPVRLRAGEAVRILPNGRLAAPDRSSGRGDLWPTGRLEFDNAPLGAVLTEANRYASSRVVLADPALADLRLTGTFRAGDTEGLARGAAAALGLSMEREPGGQFVLRPRRD